MNWNKKYCRRNDKNRDTEKITGNRIAGNSVVRDYVYIYNTSNSNDYRQYKRPRMSFKIPKCRLTNIRN